MAESARLAKKGGLKEGQAKKGCRWLWRNLFSCKSAPKITARTGVKEGHNLFLSIGQERQTGTPSSRKEGEKGQRKKSQEGPEPKGAREEGKGLKEGLAPNKEQPLKEGSRKWRMIKEREKEVWEEEQQVMLERSSCWKTRRPY